MALVRLFARRPPSTSRRRSFSEHCNCCCCSLSFSFKARVCLQFAFALAGAHSVAFRTTTTTTSDSFLFSLYLVHSLICVCCSLARSLNSSFGPGFWLLLLLPVALVTDLCALAYSLACVRLVSKYSPRRIYKSDLCLSMCVCICVRAGICLYFISLHYQQQQQ